MSLSERAYRLLKKVPKGKVTTYKEMARALNTKAYRAIGQIMRHNPDAPHTPCHRCVASDGSIGGFSGQTKGKEISRKISMLKKEGVKFEGNRIKNFEKVLYRF
ncbi:TPA: MGMT family protein [Candidatus Woesearchaeota archaeon]|nr:Methylated-DNA/protein-cysteine methyltransferase [archaeon GW2011_AR15]MBS3104014.1 MGMT family protein [Candidatus Woesearchaeota archaeon]HIH40919.1 MGMT family protein [Candidatus Woesearchaeota archaeon]